MLRALANNGGVVQANFFSAFVSEDWRKAWEAQKPERQAAEKAAEEKPRRRASPGFMARKRRWIMSSRQRFRGHR